MPITPITSKSINPFKLPMPEDAPVVIFGGVAGDGYDALSIAAGLSKVRNGEVYTYQDPYYISQESYTLAEKIDDFIEKLLQKFDLPKLAEGYPFLLVGYSYGGYFIKKAADRLNEMNIKCILFIIDEVAPDCEKAYLTNKHNTKIALVDRFAYGAKLAILHSFPREADTAFKRLSFPSSEIDGLPIDLLDERTADDAFSKAIALVRKNALFVLTQLNLNPAHFEKIFSAISEVIKDNTRNILSEPSTLNPLKVDTHILLTNAAAEKYQTDAMGNWDHYIDKKQLTVKCTIDNNTPPLIEQAFIEQLLISNHFNLVSQAPQVEALCLTIHRYFMMILGQKKFKNILTKYLDSQKMAVDAGYTKVSNEYNSDRSDDNSQPSSDDETEEAPTPPNSNHVSPSTSPLEKSALVKFSVIQQPLSTAIQAEDKTQRSKKIPSGRRYSIM